ncbi:hypothetical protein DQ244_00680 [Blastococcus sp. TBT05-19]|uniref:glycosyltransferase family 4 protein n=1 Tax=Blastococcus sp. TBT05-19 TaxID=2250581 RepID=UPI000DEB348E|nr:glycosyltransferase family 4 protein [Blastococcus sp. TBT05-19]RBY93925.1 hypothetical protein DQ244_00680 [Blastococcus sp. TBT05-19]
MIASAGHCGPTVVYLLAEYPVLSQTFVRNEIEGLRARGVNVRVLTFKTGSVRLDASNSQAQELEQPGVLPLLCNLLWWVGHHPVRLARVLRRSIIVRGLGLKLFLRLLPPLRTMAEDRSVVAVHSHFGWAAAAPTAYAAALLDTRASITLHADDIYTPAYDVGRVLNHFDHLVTVCEFNVKVIRSLLSSNVPISVIPCGVDVPEPPSPALTERTILSVGRLVPKKGFHLLIEAMAHVVEVLPNCRLQIIGDGELREGLERKASALIDSGHIEFLGAMTNDAVLEKLDHCAVFCLACTVDDEGRSDALPVVIREAMARARPVVSTDVAGIPETLTGVGWVVPRDEPGLLAEALLAALLNQERAHEMGAAARQRTMQQYTLDHTVTGMLRVFGLDVDDRKSGPCGS